MSKRKAASSGASETAGPAECPAARLQTAARRRTCRKIPKALPAPSTLLRTGGKTAQIFFTHERYLLSYKICAAQPASWLCGVGLFFSQIVRDVKSIGAKQIRGVICRASRTADDYGVFAADGGFQLVQRRFRQLPAVHAVIELCKRASQCLRRAMLDENHAAAGLARQLLSIFLCALRAREKAYRPWKRKPRRCRSPEDGSDETLPARQEAPRPQPLRRQSAIAACALFFCRVSRRIFCMTASCSSCGGSCCRPGSASSASRSSF